MTDPTPTTERRYMRGPPCVLSLTLNAGHSEVYTVAVNLGEGEAWDTVGLLPPGPFSMMSMEDVVRLLRKRGFRKDLFTANAERLGALLAERLEDKEGWHGESRAEALEGFGRDGVSR